jgi:circadian clock protein KaiB
MNATTPMQFRLYVAGDSENSMLARANLARLCEERLPGNHVIEVIDVLTDPARALAASVFVTPTLIKVVPTPVRRIIGNLSRKQAVADALGLDGVAA